MCTLLKNITLFLLVSSILFTSCSKKDAVPDVVTPAATDLTVNYVGNYIGVFSGANGSASLIQKMKVTKLSNNQIKVENNGGPISVATSTITLSISAATPGAVAGTTTDGGAIAQSANAITITYSNGDAYTGNR